MNNRIEEMNAARLAGEDLVYKMMRAEFDGACIERFANYEDYMPGHRFQYRSEDAFLGRRNLSKLFGKKNKRPARECEALESFLYQLLHENGACLNGMTSVEQFMALNNLKARDLQFLWIECGARGYKNGHPLIPKMEPHEGNWRLAWFADDIRQTQWQTYTRTRDLLATTPAFSGDDEIKEVE